MLQSVEEVYEEIWIDKGMDKKLAKGITKALITGRKNNQNEIAIKMLRAGWLKNEQIAEFTGLDKAEIEQWEQYIKC